MVMFNAVDLRQVDLNLLVVFAAVFRERSVKRAAERLFVGQSAVSMALGRLRDLLHDDLFVKVAAGVEPTSKAVAMEPQIQRALELVHHAIYESEVFDPATSSRVVRVALSDDLELWLLPVLLDELRRSAPGITVVVRPSNWYTGIDLIDRADADVACGIFPKAGASLSAETLFHERFVSLFDPAYVKAPLSMQRFLATPHAMVSVAGDLVGLVDEALRAKGKERRLVATVSSFATLGNLVVGRPLLATLPRMAAERLAGSLALATATTPVSVGPYPVTMVWHPKTARDPALRWFREALRQVVRKLVPKDGPAAAVRRRRKARR
jgi:LysR family transcriptional regulator, mexEF-oprN operon transcriptional activator